MELFPAWKVPFSREEKKIVSDMSQPNKKNAIDEQIDRNLKRVYQDAASEPLPDQFLSLLAMLKAKEEVVKNGH